MKAWRYLRGSAPESECSYGNPNDPGAVLWLAQQGMTASDIQAMLYQDSGLKGISGVSSDMRALLASEEPCTRLAIDFYAYRAAQEIGKLAVTLGGLDGLVFTAGIGECGKL
ncbi:hypothetical protein RM96_25670 [Cupriavidus sp. IDO]|nr:hypothetical protein RM96_25670 [Cupriavidus sp. IDO]